MNLTITACTKVINVPMAAEHFCPVARARCLIIHFANKSRQRMFVVECQRGIRCLYVAVIKPIYVSVDIINYNNVRPICADKVESRRLLLHIADLSRTDFRMYAVWCLSLQQTCSGPRELDKSKSGLRVQYAINNNLGRESFKTTICFRNANIKSKNMH